MSNKMDMLSREEVAACVYKAACDLKGSDAPLTELRVLFKSGRVDSGYYDNLTSLAETASIYDECEDVAGLFWVLNEINPDCLERAKNRMRERVSSRQGEKTTSDSDIIRRRFIFWDLDPGREPHTASTGREVHAAREKALAIVHFFHDELGWEYPWIAFSGNGFHLLFDTDLPPTEESGAVIRKLLKGLSQNFSDSSVNVDVSVGNLSRMTRVYHCINRKGNPTTERPHRRSAFLGRSDQYYGIA